MSRVFAYCRVSTHDQTTENQVREIKGAGFGVTPARVTTETISEAYLQGIALASSCYATS